MSNNIYQLRTIIFDVYIIHDEKTHVFGIYLIENLSRKYRQSTTRV